jgi:hypothetical protein
MKTLFYLTILAGGWLSAMTGFAFTAGHQPCLIVNRPPAAIVTERPAGISGVAVGPGDLLWMPMGADASLNWSFLSRKNSAWRHAPVLRAASNDVQPMPFPAGNSLTRRREDAALNDTRVNMARGERVLRRASPRRSDARLRFARLNRHFGHNS